MKQSGECPKCHAAQVGRLAYVADETDATTEPGGRRALWWQVEKHGRGLFAPTETHRAEVEAYVCTACGYFEEYVRDPREIDWEKLAPFSWHRPPKGPPSR